MEVNFVKRFPSVEEGRKANTIYLERGPGQRYFTIYITLADSKDYTSTVGEDAIGDLVAKAVSGVSQSHFVQDIEARDKLLADNLLTVDSVVLVKDAKGDVRFKGVGGICYFYSVKSQTFIPSFRMPVDPYAIPKLSDLDGAPEATGKEIDKAVEDAHEHENIEVLNELSVEEVQFVGEETPRKVLTLAGRPIAMAVAVNPQW